MLAPQGAQSSGAQRAPSEQLAVYAVERSLREWWSWERWARAGSPLVVESLPAPLRTPSRTQTSLQSDSGACARATSAAARARQPRRRVPILFRALWGHQERILELPCRLELSGTFLPLGLSDLLGTRCLVQSSTLDSCCTHPGSLGMVAQMGRREDTRAAGVPSPYAHSVRLCHMEYFQGLPHGQVGLFVHLELCS
ncbi:uncharacterized protein [Ovis canadensis]|uniref:uncharacterized protein isoform X3 n=1 Tax=Ovis canadensis TaxID=37174 RepID=UPI003751E476